MVGFGAGLPSQRKKQFLSLAGQQLFSLEENPLQQEARRQFEIVKQAENQFYQGCEILLSAYVDKNGAGQIATSLHAAERKAWVVPIASTDEIDKRVEEEKARDRFREFVRLYHAACPFPPHQAMVVQYLNDNKFRLAFRLRDDLRLGL